MMMSDDVVLLRIKDTADLFKVSKQTIRNRIKSSQFPKPFRSGGQMLWTLEQIKTYIETLKNGVNLND